MPDDTRAWSIKSVPEEVRTGATLAAKRARLGISEWVVRALWTQLQAEQQAGSAVVVQHPTQPQGPHVAETQMAEVLALFGKLREAAGEPPAKVRRAAWAILEDRLEAIRGHGE